MKKLFYTLILTAVSGWAHAQKFNFEVKIGGGLASQKINDPTVIKSDQIRVFNATFLAGYALPHHFGLETGVCYMPKGTVITQDAITTTPHINYIEVPLLLVKKFTFQDLGRFTLGIGGYHAIGISGHYSYETPGSETKNTLKFGDAYDVQKTDDGLRFLTGFELKNHILFNLNYDCGLKNVASQPLKDTGTSSIHNKLVYLTLGYSFY